MTDKEIIKALEDLIKNFDGKAVDFMTISFALDLINRQQAENKQLKSDVSVLRDAYMSMKDRYEYEKEKVEKAKQKVIDACKMVKTAKSEAVKECIAKVDEIITATYNKHIFGSNDLEAEEKDAIINFSDDVTYELDKLKEEMAGEGK